MRLTEKDRQENHYFVKPINTHIAFDFEARIKADDKLGQLEDIEEELGIDLITLFKALKNGICVKKYDNQIEHNDCRGIGLYGLGVIDNICSYGECDFTAKYEDYGKSWALTKEELEK